MRHTLVVLSLLALVLTACGGPEKTAAGPYANPQSGYRFQAPAGWRVFRGEARSPSGILTTVQVKSLANAEDEFVRRLPESIVPQLEDWAKHFFRLVGPPTRETSTFGGQPALHLVYPVRIREDAPESKVEYWVTQANRNMYVLRVSVPPSAPPEERAQLGELVGSWEFTEPVGGPTDESAGGVILAVPEKMPAFEVTPDPTAAP